MDTLLVPDGVETYSYDEVRCMLGKLEDLRVAAGLPEDAFDNLTLKQIKDLVENNKEAMQ